MNKSLMVENYEKDSPKHGHGFRVKRLVMCVIFIIVSPLFVGYAATLQFVIGATENNPPWPRYGRGLKMGVIELYEYPCRVFKRIWRDT